MSLPVRSDRHDVAPVVDLIKRPIERCDELAGDARLERDFMVGVIGRDENEAPAHLDLGRTRPEIATAQRPSPASIRRGECASFVSNVKQLNDNFIARSSKFRASVAFAPTPALAT